MTSIVIVDDVADIGELLGEFAARAGVQSHYYSYFSQDSADVFTKASLIILDLNMPGQDGIDVIEELSKLNVTAPVILCSGVAEDIVDSSIDILTEAGLVFGGKLLKPFSFEQFRDTLYSALAKPLFTQPQPLNRTEIELTKGDLSIALKNGWFCQYFQPQMDSKSNTLFGVECLARLEHPLFGLCYPDSFIEQLQTHDLLDAFTLQQLASTLAMLKHIQFPAHLRISFNLAPTSLRREFLNSLEQIVSSAGFHPQQICFEITELSAVSLSLEVKSLLAKMRMRGFHVSLDDFGTGFSTILELDMLPFDELKIDRAFVNNMLERKGTLAIIKHTLALAADMELLVVGEGVETVEQAKVLKELGCRYLQGYLFAKPLNLTALQALLSSTDKAKACIT